MNPHLQPWRIAPDDFPADGFASDQLEFLLGYAILAPSTHNTQPWLFRINSTDVEIFADRRRSLRAIDPFDRELTISCGAVLFNLRTAAEYFGHRYKVELLPDLQEPNLLARFHLGLRTDTSAEDILLFNAIPQRRTNRCAYEEAPLEENVLRALTEAALHEGAWLQIVTELETKEVLADLIAEADQTLRGNSTVRNELAKWVRTDAEHAQDGMTAAAAGVSNWLSFAAPLVLRAFDRGGNAAAHDREIASHSPVLAILGTSNDDAFHWLLAGQALERVLLTAQTESVQASFLNQPIEQPDLRLRLTEQIGGDGCPQVLLRLGYGPDVPPTPRRNVRQLLLRQRHP